ncbi:tetraacyldisaccharide 4'-kinase [Pseudoalteromonas sp. A25]|uniref:tetraacyldisaccharide 4'-kinase n=1 Tax=Pseudoalteromonas sp. A25 TaxID=116092 RepID=UPI0012610A39|nr:tetraacyldisaccharide 4'-kinase [Pseudoalteromonas sp. A25]BBN81792.1 tetraacyldisaccharide 4'-kinase [Pseudoalteromonas sp. A25]
MSAIEKSWYQPKSLLTFLLLPFSILFWVISTLRRLSFKLGLSQSFRAHVPVIVVGNIGIGGNGKTPFVLWLVPYLQSLGIKVAVISRGYGSKAPYYPYLVTRDSAVEEVGDEPFLLASRLDCPIVIGSDRQASCELIKARFNVDVIISDDGLQHYKMHRDIELCIVDSQRRFGNGCLIPAGPLRELPTRLNSVDLVIENGAGAMLSYTLAQSGIYRVVDNKLVQQYPQQGVAVSAIGNPQRFENSLSELGIEIVKTRHFRDHYAYGVDDFTEYNDLALFMTEKDAVKCQAFAKDNWYYLRVDAKPTEALQLSIKHILKQKEIHHGV